MEAPKHNKEKIYIRGEIFFFLIKYIIHWWAICTPPQTQVNLGVQAGCFRNLMKWHSKVESLLCILRRRSGRKRQNWAEVESRERLEGLVGNLADVFLLMTDGWNLHTLPSTDCKQQRRLSSIRPRTKTDSVFWIRKRFKMSPSTLRKITRGQVAGTEKRFISHSLEACPRSRCWHQPWPSVTWGRGERGRRRKGLGRLNLLSEQTQ